MKNVKITLGSRGRQGYMDKSENLRKMKRQTRVFNKTELVVK